VSTINYTVTVASAKFLIDGAVAPKLTFRDGDTYVFDQADSSNSGQILQFSITSNNSGSAEYTTGVTKTGTPGNAGASTLIDTSGSTPDTLYYYSSGGGTYGEEFSNSGFNTTSEGILKPIVGAEATSEKWGPMVNHAIDQIVDLTVPKSGGTFSGDLTVTGDMTVSGTTTTLDTELQSVDKLEVGANSSDYGAQINQTGTGNILQLQDSGVNKVVVADGGAITWPSGGSVNANTAYTHSQAAHLALGSTSSTAHRGDQGATAYTDRFKWDGGATGLTAATGKTSLGLNNVDNVADASQTSVGALSSGSIVSGFTSINGTPIGASSESTGKFSSLNATSIGATNEGSGVFTTLEARSSLTATGGGKSISFVPSTTTITATGGILDIVGAVGVNISLGSSAGNDFNVDVNKLVVEGDTGRVGIGVVDPDEKLEVNGNIRCDGHYYANPSHTTEIGHYNGGLIKRIRMSQGGELHFGDSGDSNFLGITEGVVGNFADQDYLSLHYRGKLELYGNPTNTKRFTFDSSGGFYPTGNGTQTLGTSSNQWSNVYAGAITGGTLKTTNGPTISDNSNFIDRTLKIKGGAGGDVGISGYDSSDNWRFQVFGNPNDYGFLGSNWGNWDIRKTVGGALYTNNSTTYYLNPQSTSHIYILTTGGPSSFGQQVAPSTDNAYNLGTGSLRWANIYTADMHLSNKGKEGGNEIDGTTGEWTIQEGDENLFAINRTTGKKFKMNLTEV